MGSAFRETAPEQGCGCVAEVVERACWRHGLPSATKTATFLATHTATRPGQDLEFSLNGAGPADDYFIRVDRAADDHRGQQYRLEVTPDTEQAAHGGGGSGNGGHFPGSRHQLAAAPISLRTDSRFDYVYRAEAGLANGPDPFFTVSCTEQQSRTRQCMTIMAWATDSSPMRPRAGALHCFG